MFFKIIDEYINKQCWFLTQFQCCCCEPPCTARVIGLWWKLQNMNNISFLLAEYLNWIPQHSTLHNVFSIQYANHHSRVLFTLQPYTTVFVTTVTKVWLIFLICVRVRHGAVIRGLGTICVVKLRPSAGQFQIFFRPNSGQFQGVQTNDL